MLPVNEKKVACQNRATTPIDVIEPASHKVAGAPRFSMAISRERTLTVEGLTLLKTHKDQGAG